MDRAVWGSVHHWVVPVVFALLSLLVITAVAVDQVDAKKKRKTKNYRKAAAVAGGGGFDIPAPWPAGIKLGIGRPCGSFYNQGSHSNRGSLYLDDRYAVDFTSCKKSIIGTPALSSLTGVVVRATAKDPQYGKTVVVDSGAGLAARYAHLDKITVAIGQPVAVGQQLGTIGSSGLKVPQGKKPKKGQSPHLHFALYRKTVFGTYESIPPSPMAGRVLSNKRYIRSATPRVFPTSSSAYASLEDQSPADGQVYLAAGDTEPFQFAVRFNEPFGSHLILRPDQQYVQAINAFSSVTGDWSGQVDPGDGNVGRFNATFHVPETYSPPNGDSASFLARWYTIKSTTNQFLGLQPSMMVHVVTQPYFTAPTGPVTVHGNQFVTVSVLNRSNRTWVKGSDNLHSVDANGQDQTYPYCGSVPEWVGGNAVLMNEASVPPGGTANFSVKICQSGGYIGPATQRLQFVQETVAHMAPIFSLQLNFN